jgi:glycosyltransferase involved in cell wall biosynthesis
MTINATVGAIVPAYNEARRIGKVLEVLGEVKSISEIWVVDDGSKDHTSEVVQKASEKDPRINLIRQPRNLGKGQAIYKAKACTQAACLLMLDADLIGLKPEHVEALISPVIRGEADMTMGIFRGGRWFTDLSHTLTPWLTGQRCFRSDLIRLASTRAASGYGLETALTVCAHERGWRCRYVPWVGVTHPPSELHRGWLAGPANRLKMYAHILRALLLLLGFRRTVAFVKDLKLTI